MEIVKFTLRGKTAFFKKPDVNTYQYFTYGHIHKIALLGLFGAVLGYNGYGQLKLERERDKKKLAYGFPEFYEKLKEVKVSICPMEETKGFIPKKIQYFNNSVGYASNEQGGNLIIKEQWLEDPAWDIYVQVDGEESKRIADAILECKCIYQPYLGKNDHYASILDAALLEGVPAEGSGRLFCLFPREAVEYEELDDEDINDLRLVSYQYTEWLPIALDGLTNQYRKEKFCYTNFPIRENQDNIFMSDGRRLLFY